MKKQAMKIVHYLFFILSSLANAQEKNNVSLHTYISSSVFFGKTLEANTNFPVTTLQSAFFIGIDKEFIEDLNINKGFKINSTGFELGYINYGNSKDIGFSVLAMPTLSISNSKFKQFKVKLGLGVAYFNKKYDVQINPNNKAISTSLNWAFKSSLLYQFTKTDNMKWLLSLGYHHQSNGHTRLPNQGLNSVFLGISSEFMWQKTNLTIQKSKALHKKLFGYLQFRYGLGINVLELSNTKKKGVNTIEIAYGKHISKRFSISLGFFARHYQSYHEYIKNNGDLVKEKYPELRDRAFINSSTYGLTSNIELFINRFSLNFGLGLNFDKPFYKIDWQLNQGYSYTQNLNGESKTITVLGELNSYYKLKKLINSKLGLKYYFSNPKIRDHKFYIEASINANLGQADFSELSIGYILVLNSI